MTVRYIFDASKGRFTVQAFAGGMLSVFAHSPTFAVRRFTGEIQFTPETIAPASLQVTVVADSLELTDRVKQEDRQEIESRMRQEVLETATYPEIKFRSSEITPSKVADNWFRLQIKGEMFVHGVTTTQQIEAQLRIMDEEIRLSGEFKLSLSAHGIKKVSALGGTINLKDELKCTFDLVGRKQDV